jgi:hypothetical protein
MSDTPQPQPTIESEISGLQTFATQDEADIAALAKRIGALEAQLSQPAAATAVDQALRDALRTKLGLIIE